MSAALINMVASSHNLLYHLIHNKQPIHSACNDVLIVLPRWSIFNLIIYFEGRRRTLVKMNCLIQPKTLISCTLIVKKVFLFRWPDDTYLLFEKRFSVTKFNYHKFYWDNEIWYGWNMNIIRFNLLIRFAGINVRQFLTDTN